MGKVKNILSLILLIVFLTSYILKLVILYKRDQIKANVLAKGPKRTDIKSAEVSVKITTMIWGAAWFFLSVAESYARQIVGELSENPFLHLGGILITFLGVCTFLRAMISMQSSWRVGIDKSTQTKLITTGIYQYSRNPAFVGFDCMFVGLFLMYPNLLTLMISVANILAIHHLVLQEEKHLRSVFGDDYIQYCSNTPRYIFL